MVSRTKVEVTDRAPWAGVTRHPSPLRFEMEYSEIRT